MIFHGNAVSPGVAVGPVYVYAPQPLCARQEFAATEQIQEEGLAYAAARAKAREQLHALRQRLEKTDVEKAAIFDAHLDLTDDEVIVEEVEAEILRHGHTAEFAVQSVYGRYANVMANMADETMAQRAADLDDVAQRMRQRVEAALETMLGTPAASVRVRFLPSKTTTVTREV